MPFLSIIIPVYKVEPYIRECLDSIAASPLDCWEAILIDDGSPDQCPQICDEYAAKDSRFRVIHQANAGVAAARNAGLDAAQGEWIWFVDSDDVVDMRPVGEMMAWLKEHQETDLVMFDLKTFDNTPDVSPDDNLKPEVCIDKNEFLLKHVCYHHPRLWYKNFCANENGRIRFTEGLRVAEDLEFQYKYLTLCLHPVKMDATLYYYRRRDDSSTGDEAYRAKVVEDLPVVLSQLAAWVKEHDVKPEPWLDFRIMKLVQNLLYSASLVPKLDTHQFQRTTNHCIAIYREQGYPFVHNKKMRIADWNVRCYFWLNRPYQFFWKLFG